MVTDNGGEAWRALREENAPPLAILDWVMPGMTASKFAVYYITNPLPRPPT